jgi:hypothetical protein
MSRESGPEPRKVSWIIKILVLAHLFAIITWSMPWPPAPYLRGDLKPTFKHVAQNPSDWLLTANAKVKNQGYVDRYLTFTGLWQAWDMFAPNPSSLDRWVDAEVQYADGSTEIIAYPRMYDIPLPRKYIMERHRKYLERVVDRRWQDRWPAFGQRLAYWAYTDPKNPPLWVTVRVHERWIEPMGTPTPDGYSMYIAYGYEVQIDKLKEDKQF